MQYKIADPELKGNAKKYVNECIDTNWISWRGSFVNKFEAEFCKFNNSKYSSTTSNGTVSLHLIFLALGIKKGDEIIVPNMTYHATPNSVRYVGAKPIFVDADRDTFNIDVDKIEEKINNKTKAIIAVHLFGNPCNMDKIMEIARKHNLYVIEDAAQAHGATYNGIKVGNFGIANSFSFFSNKIITTGEGGMITTPIAEIKTNIEILKNQGEAIGKRYCPIVLGYNYRMTNIQAAIGLSQIEIVEELLEKRKQINKWYRTYLNHLVDENVIRFQRPEINSEPVYWMNAIKIIGLDKNKVVKYLNEKSVETRPFFLPMNEINHLKDNDNYPVSKDLFENGFILPGSTKLNEEDIKHICEELTTIINELRKENGI